MEHSNLSGKRAIIYGRVSQIGRRAAVGAEHMSVDSQINESRAWVQRERCQLIATYRDDGISASTYSTKVRPDWQRVMDHIQAGDTDLLVVWEVSRATRDRAVWAALMAACQERGVRMVVGGQVHDPADPDDAFMLDLQASLAVRESGTTAKRLSRLVRARAQSGRPHGPIAYGYKSVYDPDSGRLLHRVIDPGPAAIVREIAEHALAGGSMWGKAQELNARGIPSPAGKKWNGTNLWKMVTRPTYAGLRVYRGKVVGDATWPAILTREEHDRLVIIGRDPQRKTNHGGTAVKHLLSGLAVAECGARVRVIINNRRTPGARATYTCPVDYCVARAVTRVDELLHRLMAARLAQPDITALLAELDSDGEAQIAAAKVVELKRRLDDYYEQASEDTPADERLSPVGLARVERKLLEQIKALEQRARPAVLPSVVWEVAGASAARRWDQLDINEQRVVIKALCRVVIHRGAKGGGAPFNPALIEVSWLG